MEGRGLHHPSSVLTSELSAIYCALLFTSNLCHKKFIIYTHSYSALKLLESASSTHSHVVVYILKLTLKLKKRGYEILYCWVPGHVGIRGNELADIAAKSAVDLCNQHVPLTDIKKVVKRKILEKWQLLWDAQVLNKLQSVKPLIEYWDSLRNRREEVMLTRLRIDHSRVPYSYLLKTEIEIVCSFCGSILTVRHFLVDCVYFNSPRLKYFNGSELPLDRIIRKDVNTNLF
ncbi:uncharacterized protein LOC118186157 [Stegodyphus dumicola]|uniref:uncharacterized protein LOC118186157 n=1 Tax=Stegodyphus dumicola TaxID=202533 RepID=UPI0015A97D9B|nr:uncharacterized protein LOC118186157 [Stegodyphus dumicola]